MLDLLFEVMDFWRLKRQKIHWILTGMFGDRMQCAIYCNKSHQTNVRHDDDDK